MIFHRLYHCWLRFKLFFGQIKGMRCVAEGRGVTWRCADCGQVVRVEFEL